jgi:hypothetical protein
MRTRESPYLVCVRSFACEDEDTGEVFDFTEGISYIDPNCDEARQFAENFALSDRVMEGTRESPVVPGLEYRERSAHVPDVEVGSESPPAPDLTGLLVCVRGFEFEDPDTGLLRYVRYGWDYTEPGGWLDEHYGENFVRVEEVVPSDGIPNLPPRDDDE